MFKLFLLKLLASVSRKYIHTKTGNEYSVLFIANEFSGRVGFPPTAVYMCKNGNIYARPVDEFREKFNHVGSPTHFPV